MKKKTPLRKPAVRRAKRTDAKSSSVDSQLLQVPKGLEQQTKPEELREAGIRIVAIGGSSGSLDPLVQLLDEIEPNTEMGFIFIQHIDPAHESKLAEILNRSSKLPVAEARDGERVEANRVYLIPPGVDLSISQGTLYFAPRSAPHMPIDLFFRALAEDLDGRCIGVILSGAGTDGSHGLMAIKACGGLTFAQEPKSAKFDAMPRAAIATGEVDSVLTPDKIGKELNSLRAHRFEFVRQPPAQTDQEPTELKQILRSVMTVSGTDLSFYKTVNLMRRIDRRMLINHVTKIEGYRKLVQESSAEAEALHHDILISVTSFFRDGASVDGLNTLVFPELVKKTGVEKTIRMWVPGCSSGEEAYSLAIALTEFAESYATTVQPQIFATDISEAAIERARAGLYPASIVADVSQSRLRRFFVKADSGYQVIKSIRERCIFARHNLLSDPPFSHIDLVSCRNVLIYFRNHYQRQAFETFHFALNPNGFLLLGRSETIGSSELFAPVDGRQHIYRKSPDSARQNVLLLRRERTRRSADPDAAQVSDHSGALADLQREADRLLIERYAPPGVIVNEQFDVVHVRGSTGVFLEAPPGQATLNAVKMAREDFRLLLQSSLFEARKRNKVVLKEGLSVQHHGSPVIFTLAVRPILSNDNLRYFLVTFEENVRSQELDALQRGDRAKKSTPAQRQVKKLSDELASTRRQLRAIIEELETTNEEMKAANEEVLSSNEELLSMNEELETAKEELQSTNEELTTVNDELQNRNNELGIVAADLNNLLTSIDIPILMLSRDLRIRRYTPNATKAFNIIPADIGRPITDINLNINTPEFETMLLEVMDNGKMIEREVQDRSEHWHSLRIEPFRTLENHIDGVVMLLIDLLRTEPAQPVVNA